MQKAVVGGEKNHISIELKLESLIAYHIGFVVKLF